MNKTRFAATCDLHLSGSRVDVVVAQQSAHAKFWLVVVTALRGLRLQHCTAVQGTIQLERSENGKDDACICSLASQFCCLLCNVWALLG